ACELKSAATYLNAQRKFTLRRSIFFLFVDATSASVRRRVASLNRALRRRRRELLRTTTQRRRGLTGCGKTRRELFVVRQEENSERRRDRRTLTSVCVCTGRSCNANTPYFCVRATIDYDDASCATSFILKRKRLP